MRALVLVLLLAGCKNPPPALVAGSPCSDTDPCPTGFQCSSGRCQESCGDTASCAANQFCASTAPSTCVPRSTGMPCADAADCAKDANHFPRAESSGRCATVGAGKVCVGLGLECDSADDCGPGEECDVSKQRCRDRLIFTCGRAGACRAGESCLRDATGTHCVDGVLSAGQPCDQVSGVGACAPTLVSAGHGVLFCRAGTPTAEVCGDGLDNDCNGKADGQDPGLAGRPELCDRIDNDCDGLIDADDPGFARHDEICDDGVDNDCNGLVDGADPALASRPETCNGKDDDCNGLVDGHDPALANRPEACNGVDDDCDGRVDEDLFCHSVVLNLSKVDDEMFVWIGGHSRNEVAVCSAAFAHGTPGEAVCDLTQIVRDRGMAPGQVPFTIAVVNSGCFGTSGDADLVTDVRSENVLHQGAVTAHCSWVERSRLTVDFATGNFVVTGRDACINDGDCRPGS